MTVPTYHIERFGPRRNKLGLRRWYWRLVADSNGQTIAQSEPYSTVTNRDATCVNLSRATGMPVEDE